MKPPCKDCKRRHLGCHSTCEEYIAYDEYRQKIRQINYKQTMSDADYLRVKLKNKKYWR